MRATGTWSLALGVFATLVRPTRGFEAAAAGAEADGGLMLFVIATKPLIPTDAALAVVVVRAEALTAALLAELIAGLRVAVETVLAGRGPLFAQDLARRATVLALAVD